MIAIPLDTLAFIIEKARAYEAEIAPEGMEEGSNPTDDRAIGVLEDTPDNPIRAELRAAIDALNEDEVAELLALTWIGCGDYTADDWTEALAAAQEAQDERAADYLMETPNLADLLDEGLAALGLSTVDEEARHGGPSGPLPEGETG